MLKYSLKIGSSRHDVHNWTILMVESTPLLSVFIRCTLKLAINLQVGLPNTV